MASKTTDHHAQTQQITHDDDQTTPQPVSFDDEPPQPAVRLIQYKAGGMRLKTNKLL